MSENVIEKSKSSFVKLTSTQKRSKLDEDHFTETTFCPVCSGVRFNVLRNASYPVGLTQNEILKSYHSSSDQALMDQLVECETCNLIYLNPRMKESFILESYSSAVDPVFFAQNEHRIATFLRVLKKIVKMNNVTPSKDNQVLDIGCAGGAFPKAASDLGFKVIGIEPSKWLVEKGKEHYGLDLRAGTLQDHQFANGQFKMITLWDVIEHLTKPSETLIEIKRILRKDGLLIVNYPDHASFVRFLMGFKWPFFLSVHLFYFTPRTIRKFLDGLGFETIKITPYWQTLELGYVLHRAANVFPFLSFLHKAIRFLGLGRLPVTYNLGQSMVIARIKP